MLFEFVSAFDRIHIVAPTGKYWTLCGQVASVHKRWHAPIAEIEDPAAVCEACAKHVAVRPAS